MRRKSLLIIAAVACVVITISIAYCITSFLLLKHVTKLIVEKTFQGAEASYVDENDVVLVFVNTSVIKNGQVTISCEHCRFKICRRVTLMLKLEKALKNLTDAPLISVIQVSPSPSVKMIDLAPPDANASLCSNRTYSRLVLTGNNITRRVVLKILREGLLFLTYTANRSINMKIKPIVRIGLDFAYLKVFNITNEVPTIGNRTGIAYLFKIRLDIPEGCSLSLDDLKLYMPVSAEVHGVGQIHDREAIVVRPSIGGYVDDLLLDTAHYTTQSLIWNSDNIITIRGFVVLPEAFTRYVRFLKYGAIILISLFGKLECKNNSTIVSTILMKYVKLKHVNNTYWTYNTIDAVPAR